jgi:oxygen-dependent protoporphyrinogen oxidase
VLGLAAELGVAERVIGQLTAKSYAFDGRELHELARGEAARFLGFQVPQRDLGQGIRSFRAGMGEIVRALAHALGPTTDIRVGTLVKELTLRGGRVTLAHDGATDEFERVFVATSAAGAAATLARQFGAPAVALERSPTLSSVTVSLAYRRTAISHALDATGFVVAEGAELEGFRACTFTSSKFGSRAADDRALLRAFFRPGAGELTQDDAFWITRAERAMGRALAPTEAPIRAWVARWVNALPVYDAEHREHVARLETALAGSGVVLAGAAFHGSGIDAAVRSARRAAEEHSV